MDLIIVTGFLSGIIINKLANLKNSSKRVNTQKLKWRVIYVFMSIDFEHFIH